MRHRRRSNSVGILLSFRILLVGFWAVVLGLLFIYVAHDLTTTVGLSSEGAQASGLAGLFIEPMGLLYEGGVLTLVTGGVLMFFGGTLVAGN